MKFLDAKRATEPGQNKMLGGPAQNKSKKVERATPPAPPAGGDESEGPFASDEAEALAKEFGIDPSDVSGSGRNGKITKQDVRDAIVKARAAQQGEG